MKSVSIIIPVYNGEQHIEQCFEYICQQTYEHSAIECIFVNDGSNDDSESIINKLITADHSGIHFRLITYEHNQGVSAARNKGIIEACNDYLFFMDSDDIITPECIELLVRATNTYPNATIIVGNLLNKKGHTFHHTQTNTICQKNYLQNLHDVLLFIYTSYPVNKLTLRKFVIENELFFPIGITYFEDLHWNIDIARLANEIVYLPEVTYFYEYNASSSMSTSLKRQDTIAKCYMSLILKVMTLKEPKCIVESHLFICYYLMKLLNMGLMRTVNTNDIYLIRNKLFREALLIRKPLLVIYELQLFQPFRTIANFKAIKNRSAELRLWVCNKC